MAVRPSDIENRERDQHLTDRGPRPSGGQDEAQDNTARDTADLGALRERLKAAKIVGKDPIPHCGDCWKRGWAAAVRAIEGA